MDEKYVAMTMGQLRELTEDVDDDKEIRIWVEERNGEGTIYLSGRKLIGVLDEEEYCCFCAGLYDR